MPRHPDVSPASPATTPTENPHAAKSEKKKKQAKDDAFGEALKNQNQDVYFYFQT